MIFKHNLNVPKMSNFTHDLIHGKKTDDLLRRNPPFLECLPHP